MIIFLSYPLEINLLLLSNNYNDVIVSECPFNIVKIYLDLTFHILIVLSLLPDISKLES